MLHLTLVRGLPGSGKTTFAAQLAKQNNLNHFEADMFFYQNGKYQFDGTKIKDAHRWCLLSTINSLQLGCSCVVANTFTTQKEMQPYIDLARVFNITLTVIETAGDYKSVHDVPQATIEKMKARWEPFVNEPKELA